MDRFSKEERSILMSKIRATGTDIERQLLLCVKPFWAIERYRKNLRTLPGKPDVVFLKRKIAVFADGDFWHGKDFEKWDKKIPDFWQKKIASNIARDLTQTKALKKQGYKVIRFWGSVIKKNPRTVRAKIEHALKQYDD